MRISKKQTQQLEEALNEGAGGVEKVKQVRSSWKCSRLVQVAWKWLPFLIACDQLLLCRLARTLVSAQSRSAPGWRRGTSANFNLEQRLWSFSSKKQIIWNHVNKTHLIVFKLHTLTKIMHQILGIWCLVLRCNKNFHFYMLRRFIEQHQLVLPDRTKLLQIEEARNS